MPEGGQIPPGARIARATGRIVAVLHLIEVSEDLAARIEALAEELEAQADA